MNTRLNLASIILTLIFIAAACSPKESSPPIVDRVQSERNYEMVQSLPVTGGQPYVAEQRAYDFEQEVRAYPSHQVHSACASADIHRQGRCEEKEQIRKTLLPGNGNTEAPASPLQKLHSHCVSEDLNRQNYCMD